MKDAASESVKLWGMDARRSLPDTNVLSDLLRHPKGAVRERITTVGEAWNCMQKAEAVQLRWKSILVCSAAAAIVAIILWSGSPWVRPAFADTVRAATLVTVGPVGESTTAVWVAPDKDDYAPGATASITGSGFWANEVVTLHVVHTDTTRPGGTGHEPWTVTADASGSIATSWYVNPDDSAGSAFKLTAVGRSSGLAAQATFTDAAVLTITLGSQETFWLDDNKCNAQGPRAAWLSFIIKNTGTTAASNVTVTFAGFTGTNASFFSAPADLTRTFSTIAAGAQEPVYFYVDYAEVCNHNQGGGSPYAGYTANYTLTVNATGVGPVVRNGTVTTNDLLTAAAAGFATRTTLGPGFYVGQLLTQTVTYAFGNNSDLFFQPAGDSGFDAACIRLVGSEITNVSGTVSPSLIGLKDQLWFPTVSVPAGGGNIFMTYTWQIRCVNRTQTLHPWAAAKSGQKYKYEGFQSSTIFPASQSALTATKSVSPTILTDNTGGPVTWTVTFTNVATVPVILSKITDVIPACMSINDPAASGSQVTAANSSSIPSVGASGTVNWVGIDLGNSASSTYQVPASGTLTLKYKTNVSSCSFPASYTNSATGTTGTTTVGPAHATLTIGAVPAIALTKSASPLTYGTVGQTITYTYTIQNTGTATLAGPFSVTDNKLGTISSCGTGPLAPNGSTSCMVTYAITQADLDAGSIVNTATASTTYNSQPVSSTPSSTTVTALPPVVTVQKSVALVGDLDSSGNPSPGDTLQYTMTITNSGAAAATGVILTDLPDANTTLVAGSVLTSQGTVTDGNTGVPPVTVNVGMISGGGMVTVTFQVTINSPLPVGVTQVANQGAVNGTNFPTALSDDPSTPAVNDPTATTVVAAPVVKASKTETLYTDADSNGVPSPGDTLRYEITLTNTGNTAATGVVFSDTPDGNTTLVAGSVATSQGSITSGNTGTPPVTVNVGTILAGGSVTISFRVTITSPLPAGVTTVSNQGLVTGSNFSAVFTDDPRTVAINDPTVTAVTAAPRVTARKTVVLLTDADGDGVPSPGDTLLYQIRVRNTGNIAATGLSFSDTPDPHTPLVVGSVQTDMGTVTSGNTSGDTGVGVTIDTLAADPNAVVTISFEVTIAFPLPAGVTTVSNQGEVTGTNLPAVLTDDPTTVAIDDPTVTAVTAAPRVTARKTAVLLTDADGDGVPSPGDTLLYQVRVRNTGNVAATGVSFSDTPDPNTLLVVGSVQTDVGTVTSGNTSGDTSVGVTIGTLTADSNAVVTISFEVIITSPLPGDVTTVSNQGEVTGTNFSAVFTDDPRTVAINDPTVTAVTAAPRVTARKTVVLLTDADGDGVPSPGDTLLYQIRVRNTGNIAATGLSFSDTPDPNTPLVVGSVQTDVGTVTSGNTSSDTSVGVAIGTLAADPNAVVTISFEVTITSSLPGGVTTVSNQGVVTGTNLPAVLTDDPTTVAINDPTVTAVTAAPLVTARKTAVLLTDADGNGVPSPGDTLLYQIRVRNTGNVAATGVSFSDTPDSNTALVPTSVQTNVGTVTSGNSVGDTSVGVDIGTLAADPNAVVTISFAVTVASPLPAGVTRVSNQGVVTGTNFSAVLTDDPETVAINDPTVTAVTAAPLVTARKTAVLLTDADGNGFPSPGDTLLYQIRVRNTGNVAATGVSFSDTPDSNTALVATSVQTNVGTVTSGNSAGDTSVGVDIGTLAADPNAVVTISFAVTITSPLPAGVITVSNQGVVTGTNVPAVLSDDPDTVTINDPTVTAVTAAPLVTARKTAVLLTDADGNGVPSPGDTLLYQIRVRNTGNVAATGVSFSDIPDSNTTLVVGSVQTDAGSVTSGNTVGDTSVGVVIAILAADPGAVTTISFEVQINFPLPAGVTTVSNQGVVMGTNVPAVLTDDPDTVTINDPTVTAVTAAPLVTARKTAVLLTDADGNGVPSPGDTLLYEIRVRNRGNVAATGVSFSDIPDSNTTLLVGSVQTDAGSVTSGNTVGNTSVGVSIGTLAVDPIAVTTISFAVTINSPLPAGVTTVSNQGVVMGTNVPAVLTDDPDTVTINDPTVTAVTAAPLVTARKTAVLLTDADGNGVPSPGDTLLYQIRVRNTGNVAATGVSFSDIPDSNTTLVAGSVQTDAGSVTSGNGVGDTSVGVSIGTLAVNPIAVTTISFAVTIRSPLPAGVTTVSNQGVVTGTNIAAVLTDDPDTVTIDDPTETAVTAAPLVTARKTAVLLTDADGNGVPSPGDTLLYQIRVRNTGNVAATGVSFSDTPDSNTTLVVGSVQTDAGSVTSGNTSGNTSVGVSIGTLATDPLAVTTISFEVQINSPLPAGVTTVSNQGLVTGTSFSTVLTDNPDTVAIDDPTVTAVTAAPLVTARKTAVLLTDADGNGVPSPGDTLLYQIRVRNTGNVAATGVSFSDTPDSNTTLVVGSVETDAGSVTSGNAGGDTSVGVNIGTLAVDPNAVVTISFAVTINAVTTVSNQGVVSGGNFSPVPTDDPTTDAASDPTVTQVFPASIPTNTPTNSPTPTNTPGGMLTPTSTRTPTPGVPIPAPLFPPWAWLASIGLFAGWVAMLARRFGTAG